LTRTAKLGVSQGTLAERIGTHLTAIVYVMESAVEAAAAVFFGVLATTFCVVAIVPSTSRRYVGPFVERQHDSFGRAGRFLACSNSREATVCRMPRTFAIGGAVFLAVIVAGVVAVIFRAAV